MNKAGDTFPVEQLKRPELKRVAAGSRVSFGVSGSAPRHTKKQPPMAAVTSYIVITARDAVYLPVSEK